LNIALAGETRNAYTILIGKRLEKRSLGKLNVHGKYKLILKKSVAKIQIEVFWIVTPCNFDVTAQKTSTCNFNAVKTSNSAYVVKM
jgi:hypothetical protein